jgi:hypothetical protein
METLHYNHKLAALAQTWSKRCVFEHGQPPHTAVEIGYDPLGQNIFAHEDPKFDVEWAVKAWYDEKKDYHFESAACSPGKVCGHYTAVTWAHTTEVGCGLTFCPSISGLHKAHFIVCNYAPAGNFQGEHPYKKGPECTKCDSGSFYCNKGLCNSKTCKAEGKDCKCKAACKGCSKKTSKCRCECGPGSTGPDCSADCKDTHPKCGANPGWPEFVCENTAWKFVKDKCPKMCGVCKPRAPGKPCRVGSKISALKRIMLGYLDNELDDMADEPAQLDE